MIYNMIYYMIYYMISYMIYNKIYNMIYYISLATIWEKIAANPRMSIFEKCLKSCFDRLER